MSLTFLEYLKNLADSNHVPDFILPGIRHCEAIDASQANNLFSITPCFLKSCDAEPEAVLEALLLIYNRWIQQHIEAVSSCIERCITANRVVFLQNGQQNHKQLCMWREINSNLQTISGAAQDLKVQTNYLAMEQATIHKKP